MRWISRVAVASATSSMSSIVTMPMSVGDRERRAVVLAELRHRGFLIVSRLQRDELPVHQILDALVHRREQEVADADVVDEQ